MLYLSLRELTLGSLSFLADAAEARLPPPAENKFYNSITCNKSMLKETF